ncbi:MAG TPA: helix-turn-helix domain-containing protein, partial [Kribbella sp.]
MTDVGRTAIIRAARRAFARQPYDAVTLRGIAADAGVSASLIVKHFGGKESLFDRVADFSEAAELLLAAPNEELGRQAVRALVQ